MALGGDLQPCHHPPGQSDQVGRLGVQCQPPCLQARHIKQVFGEFDQPGRRLVDVLDRLPLPRGQGWSLASCRLEDQHLRKALHDGKRAA